MEEALQHLGKDISARQEVLGVSLSYIHKVNMLRGLNSTFQGCFPLRGDFEVHFEDVALMDPITQSDGALLCGLQAKPREKQPFL